MIYDLKSLAVIAICGGLIVLGGRVQTRLHQRRVRKFMESDWRKRWH